MINSVCGRQSTGRIVSGIQEQLVAKGHECVVAYGESNSNAKNVIIILVVKQTDIFMR